MGTLHRGIGKRTMAVALMMGLAGGGGSVKEQAAQRAVGDAMMASLRWHHRGIVSHKPSGAAAAKRASVKRRNIAKMNRRKRRA